MVCEIQGREGIESQGKGRTWKDYASQIAGRDGTHG